MKKVLPLISLFLLILTTAQAQLESINLNKYKLKDFRYSSLGTNLSLNGDYSKDDRNSSNEFLNSDYEYKNKLFNTNLNLGYSMQISNRKYVGYHSINGNYTHNFNYYSSKNNSNPLSETENKLTNYQLNLSTYNSFYLSDKLFWGLNFLSNTSQQNETKKLTREFEPYSTEKNIDLFTRNRLAIQIGYGRIENVTDARQAIYILDDLNKKSRLTHEPTPEEALEFADFITSVLNKRVIDSREKRIEEYTLIDSFLVSKGLISKQDGKYFGILSDNWNYARTQGWYTGSKVYFGIITELNDRHEFKKLTYPDYPYNDEKSTEEIMNKNIGIEAGFEVNWIKGLKWINSFDCRISYIIDHYDPYYSDYEFSQRDDKLNVFKSNLSYSLSYVPNTRTIITGETGASYWHLKDLDKNKRTDLAPYARISCTYYLSQKFQVNGFTQLTYYKNKESYDDIDYNSNSIRINFGINLRYYFF